MTTMKRVLIAFAIIMLAAGSLWAKDDEIIVTRQLTTGQRNSLPEKTISVETKKLTFNKKAFQGLADAITSMMDTIAQEDYQNRTFVMMIDAKADGEVGIAVHSDDIVTRAKLDASIYLGVISHKRYHFVVLMGKNNSPLLEQTFKKQGKVKFVQEFEFVDFKTPNYPTNVIATWSPDSGLKWLTVIINEDPETARQVRTVD